MRPRMQALHGAARCARCVSRQEGGQRPTARAVAGVGARTHRPGAGTVAAGSQRQRRRPAGACIPADVARARASAPVAATAARGKSQGYNNRLRASRRGGSAAPAAQSAAHTTRAAVVGAVAAAIARWALPDDRTPHSALSALMAKKQARVALGQGRVMSARRCARGAKHGCVRLGHRGGRYAAAARVLERHFPASVA